MPELFIGLMSGTSLDGVDGVLADFTTGRLRVLRHETAPFSGSLRSELLALNTSGADELHRAALAGNALARSYAGVVQALLDVARLQPKDIEAIGAHGQTVRHRPLMFDGTGYSLQLNNPSLLAELCGIAVVADFRSRDLAAGGQGAPLVPAFHQGVFGLSGESRAVLNLGGIANLSILSADGSVTGFDCGPANALMDHWCQRHTGQAYDAGGAWASRGHVLPALLSALLAEPYLQWAPPKSTGRDLFNAPWLEAQLQRHAAAAAPEDVQATLAEFTAQICAHDVKRHGAGSRTLVVCGGGALNTHLMQRLADLLPGVAVDSSALHGLPPLQVEAAAFAWLARQALRGAPGSLPAVTGARGTRVLGGIYPA
jgi:anhydro-N-acetylmuramic acid kinase